MGSEALAARMVITSLVYDNPLFEALGWPTEPYYWGA